MGGALSRSGAVDRGIGHPTDPFAFATRMLVLTAFASQAVAPNSSPILESL